MGFEKMFTNINMTTNKDFTEDCYYFLYSTCKRGDQCLYRHNELSKQCNILCKQWESNKQCSEDCPFRHSYYHLQKPRNENYCYWEENGGCAKEFCEFKHKDVAKDEWKLGKVKKLDVIRKEKNESAKQPIVAIDKEEFEKERRKIRQEKKDKEALRELDKTNLLAIRKMLSNCNDKNKAIGEELIKDLKEQIKLTISKIKLLTSDKMEEEVKDGNNEIVDGEGIIDNEESSDVEGPKRFKLEDSSVEDELAELDKIISKN